MKSASTGSVIQLIICKVLAVDGLAGILEPLEVKGSKAAGEWQWGQKPSIHFKCWSNPTRRLEAVSLVA